MPLSRTPEDLAAYVMADPLCRRLAEAAATHNREMALVGGCVRDWLLDRPALDWDLVVPGDPTPLVTDLARAFKGPVVVLDADFGVLRTRLEGGLMVDVVRQQGDTLSEDLHRRDLTVNAIAVRLTDGQLIDPTGGLADLALHRVRAVSLENLEDDPLRLLRIFRFAASLDFEIDSETLGWARELAPLIAEPAGERVLAELAKLVVTDRAAHELHAMWKAGVLSGLFPELGRPEAAIATSSALTALINSLPTRFGDAGARTLALLGTEFAGERTRRTPLMLGALFMGLTTPGGVEAVGDKLKWSAREGEWVAALVRERSRALTVLDDPDPSRATYRLFRDFGEVGLGMALLGLAEAEILGKAGPALAACERVLTDYWRYQDHWAASPRVVNGRDLIVELKLKPGPELGRILESLDEAQAVGEVRSREEALAWAARMLSERE